MSSLDAKLDFLCRPRERWVELDVRVGALEPSGAVAVSSRHTSPRGELLHHFAVTWPDATRVDTEYAQGLSVVHDVKDHIFHGLGITPLTEIQTIVQTYYGRELSGGRSRRVEGGDYRAAIKEHVYHELFGTGGRPLVYDLSAISQQGLLDRFAPAAGEDERMEVFFHLYTLCEDVMLPALTEAYAGMPELRALQASIVDQPELTDRFLPKLRWADRAKAVLRLDENAGYQVRHKAYVNEELARVTRAIRDGIEPYIREHGLFPRYGKIFDVEGYVLA